jgi:sigma-B regulation protein RsbU (phosphoserine phosphatase)
MSVQSLTNFRVEVAYIILGTIFVSFGFSCLAVAAIRRRGELRVLVWLGMWSGMYGTGALLRSAAFKEALPNWLRVATPFTSDAIGYLLVVAALLVWSELTLKKMRLVTQVLAGVGFLTAIAGFGFFMATGSDSQLLTWNRLLAVCALLYLGTVVVVPKLSARFLAFPNRILTASTIIFTVDALYTNIADWQNLPRVNSPLFDDLIFAGFLFSFAYVAGQKVFANERKLLGIESELEIARQIQASLLPACIPEVESLQIAVSYLPMTAVGGDFYQFAQVDPRHIGFLVADVTGHGIPAALISTMLKVAMQSVLDYADRPAELLRGLNRTLTGQLHGQLISAAYLWLDLEKRQASYSAAGHPPLLRWREGHLNRIESNGLLFGVVPDLDYPVCAMDLRQGDRFLLCTDGVVEPENAAGEAFGDHRLECVVRDHKRAKAAELSDQILTEVRLWQSISATQQDDITLIVIDVL